MDGLRTPRAMHYALKREGDALVWKLGAGMTPPPEGLILTWPLGRRRARRRWMASRRNGGTANCASTVARGGAGEGGEIVDQSQFAKWPQLNGLLGGT